MDVITREASDTKEWLCDLCKRIFIGGTVLRKKTNKDEGRFKAGLTCDECWQHLVSNQKERTKSE